MKRKIIWTAIIATALSCLLSIFAMASLLRPTALDIVEVDLKHVADGEYVAACQNKILFAVVRVKVRDHEINGVEVLHHKQSYMSYAKQIANDVMAEQSLMVDTISGATLTCNTVKKAIEDALRQGLQ